MSQTEHLRHAPSHITAVNYGLQWELHCLLASLWDASKPCGMQPVWLDMLDLYNLRLNRLWPWFPGKWVPHTVSDDCSGRRPASTGQLA